MKKKAANTGVKILGAAGNGIKWFFIAVWKILGRIFTWLKYILIIIERSAKTIAIFIISIGFFILAATASLYLFSATFGLKESPVFQELRDKIAKIYMISVEDDLNEIEQEVTINN